MKRGRVAWPVQKRKGNTIAGTDLNKYGHVGNVILYVLIFSDPV